MRLRRLFILLLALLCGSAWAGGLTVSPVKVELDAKTNAMVISLKNSGDQTKRYQLEMMNWGESPSGEMKLDPTRDVVFFPQLLTLKAGEDRNVRVGITRPPSAVERSYRLFIQELPDMKTQSGVQSVQVLTRVGIPIFVKPAQAASRVQLGPVSVKAGSASFSLSNGGNAHARPSKVVFTGLDAQGNTVFEKAWSGWYLLAGGERDYSVQVPAAACKRATSFHAEVLGERLSLSKSVQAAAGACGS